VVKANLLCFVLFGQILLAHQDAVENPKLFTYSPKQGASYFIGPESFEAVCNGKTLQFFAVANSESAANDKAVTLLFSQNPFEVLESKPSSLHCFRLSSGEGFNCEDLPRVADPDLCYMFKTTDPRGLIDKARDNWERITGTVVVGTLSLVYLSYKWETLKGYLGWTQHGRAEQSDTVSPPSAVVRRENSGSNSGGSSGGPGGVGGGGGGSAAAAVTGASTAAGGGGALAALAARGSGPGVALAERARKLSVDAATHTSPRGDRVVTARKWEGVVTPPGSPAAESLRSRASSLSLSDLGAGEAVAAEAEVAAAEGMRRSQSAPQLPRQ